MVGGFVPSKGYIHWKYRLKLKLVFSRPLEKTAYLLRTPESSTDNVSDSPIDYVPDFTVGSTDDSEEKKSSQIGLMNFHILGGIKYWALLTQLAVIPDAMVKTESVDTAVQKVINVLISAADLSIPKVSNPSFQRYKPWWNTDCQTAYKNQEKLWGIFCRYPTTENLLAFKKAKANARRSGFRKGRSTLDNLVFLESQIRDAFVRRNHLVSLFFDIEKAYDHTWRYGIIRNMYEFGLRGNLPIFINFLVSYFNVRIGHSSSHKFMQDHGVPQGSVLSVTLFNIHMSNILHQLPPSVRGMLCVDDLQVSCQGSDMRLIERQLQTTVNLLVKWCDKNGHMISPSKSSCVHFCRKRNLHPDPSIHIGHIQISVVSEVHFLGVIFDCKLTFLSHVLYLRKKCERSLNILKVLSNALWGADSLVTPSIPSPNTFTFGLWLCSADTAARSMSDHMQLPVFYRDLKTSTQNYIHRVWQETWDEQILNKLHNLHPSTSCLRTGSAAQ
ncbi:putative RNA-directed DNA polymerase from transposon X-element [Trichonephila clavipes]|nr:putative RNA-directed DNA polymerase from transposon X-element [Trichonephila clavipes]